MFLPDPPLTPDAARLQQDDRDESGYVWNVTRLWSWRPDLLEAMAALRTRVVAGSSLTKRDLGVMVCATAATIGDSYCALSWGQKLALEAGAPVAAAVLQDDMASGSLTARDRALAAWARCEAADANAVTRADVDALRAAGFSEREVFEAALYVALRIAFSTVNDALGAGPDAQLAEAVPPEVRAAVRYGRAPQRAAG
jgi:uncharacterized peroxidase-related enzyme